MSGRWGNSRHGWREGTAESDHEEGHELGQQG